MNTRLPSARPHGRYGGRWSTGTWILGKQSSTIHAQISSQEVGWATLKDVQTFHNTVRFDKTHADPEDLRASLLLGEAATTIQFMISEPNFWMLKPYLLHISGLSIPWLSIQVINKHKMCSGKDRMRRVVTGDFYRAASHSGDGIQEAQPEIQTFIQISPVTGNADGFDFRDDVKRKSILKKKYTWIHSL